MVKEELKKGLGEIKLPYREDTIREDDNKLIVDWKKLQRWKELQEKGLVLSNYFMELTII